MFATSCLVTDPVVYQEAENLPPLIDRMDPPAARVVRVDNSLGQSVLLRCEAFDPNPDDVLEARNFLDYERNDSILGEAAVTVSAEDSRRRLVTASFAPDDFSVGCHTVEIDVIDDPSGWDQSGLPRNRGVKPDVGKATATWFVLAFDGEGDPRNDIALESCQ